MKLPKAKNKKITSDKKFTEMAEKVREDWEFDWEKEFAKYLFWQDHLSEKEFKKEFSDYVQQEKDKAYESGYHKALSEISKTSKGVKELQKELEKLKNK